MAYPHPRCYRLWLGAAIACCVLLSTPAFAIDPIPSPAAQQTPPALSPQCDVPAADIAAPAPLPNVTKVLAEHGTLHILAIGSASSAGLGSTAGVKSYPVQISDILESALKGVNVEIANRGVGGEVAQTSADRIRSEVALMKPDLVLWQLGTNDALSRVDPDQFTDVVKTTIEWLRDSGIDVVLVGLQYTSRFAKDESYDAIRQALQKIATDEKVLYVRRYDAMKFIAQTRANLHLMANDNFHLSDLGNQCMAEHVARAMIANLFVKRFRPNPN
ncbi:SGNH/GDSL hydrolase family protein [Beijerinckia sp. L45]|uniref:SGNH/GDSL hydrolase family protein n=1 Tax=Beijerinckia sp. L45 TaxID=1641855 RepID=UPI00131DCE28|nr:SGNH/GDSL hydrolase family protein [Beijerinckia sp. L45]